MTQARTRIFKEHSQRPQQLHVMLDQSVATNFHVKQAINKQRAYKHIRQHTPTRSLTSSNSLLTTCIPDMADTFKAIPVVQIRENKDSITNLVEKKRQLTIADLNNNRNKYNNYSHYRKIKSKLDISLPPINPGFVTHVIERPSLLYVSTHLPSTKPETAHASQSAPTDQKSAPTRPTLPATINNGQRHVITTDSDMTNTNFFTINGTSTAKQEQTFKKRLHIDPSKEAAMKPKIVKSEDSADEIDKVDQLQEASEVDKCRNKHALQTQNTNKDSLKREDSHLKRLVLLNKDNEITRSRDGLSTYCRTTVKYMPHNYQLMYKSSLNGDMQLTTSNLKIFDAFHNRAESNAKKSEHSQPTNLSTNKVLSWLSKKYSYGSPISSLGISSSSCVSAGDTDDVRSDSIRNMQGSAVRRDNTGYVTNTDFVEIIGEDEISCADINPEKQEDNTAIKSSSL